MVQAQLVRDQVRVAAKVWDAVRAEAKWGDRLLPARVESVYAQVAAQQSHILSDSPVIKEVVLNVVRK